MTNSRPETKRRGQLPKAYLRIDPALGMTHPEPGTFVRLLSLANLQPERGRFKEWALVEAANVVVLQRARFPERHVSHLYQRIQSRSGHAKAVVAVARHLAEAAFWVLKKDEPYREPASQSRPAPSQPRSTRASHERKTLVH